jgi:hypothetical protein
LKVLEYEAARLCYASIQKSEHVVLRRELFQKALEYANIRAQWNMMSTELRVEVDQRRTIAHNAFIDACNIMSRNMGKSDEDNSWRATLGDDRKIIGDFACYIHCFLGIEARLHVQSF